MSLVVAIILRNHIIVLSQITLTENLTESDLSNRNRDKLGSWHIAQFRLDSAPTHSFVTSLFVNRLHLSRKSAKLSVTILNSIKSFDTRGITDMLIRSRFYNEFGFSIIALAFNVNHLNSTRSIDRYSSNSTHSITPTRWPNISSIKSNSLGVFVS